MAFADSITTHNIHYCPCPMSVVSSLSLHIQSMCYVMSLVSMVPPCQCSGLIPLRSFDTVHVSRTGVAVTTAAVVADAVVVAVVVVVDVDSAPARSRNGCAAGTHNIHHCPCYMSRVSSLSFHIQSVCYVMSLVVMVPSYPCIGLVP